MDGLCASLLKVAANPLKLPMLVSKFSTRREVRCRGGGDVDDAQINAENCPVLVVILHFNLFLGFRFAKPKVQVVFAIAF
jgi:hypothetical protein